jgi:hypothetical protein
MVRRRAGLMAVAFLCLVGCGFTPLQEAKKIEEKPAAAGERPFFGRVIVVHANGFPMVPVSILEKVEIKQLGNQSFLVGKITGNEEAAENGRIVWVALRAVVHIAEFKDVKDAKNAQGGFWGAPQRLVPVPAAPPLVEPPAPQPR